MITTLIAILKTIFSFIFIAIVILINIPLLIIFKIIGANRPFERFVEFIYEIIK